jgi:hypothetical protein
MRRFNVGDELRQYRAGIGAGRQQFHHGVAIEGRQPVSPGVHPAWRPAGCAGPLRAPPSWCLREIKAVLDPLQAGFYPVNPRRLCGEVTVYQRGLRFQGCDPAFQVEHILIEPIEPFMEAAELHEEGIDHAGIAGHGTSARSGPRSIRSSR